MTKKEKKAKKHADKIKLRKIQKARKQERLRYFLKRDNRRSSIPVIKSALDFPVGNRICYGMLPPTVRADFRAKARSALNREPYDHAAIERYFGCSREEYLLHIENGVRKLKKRYGENVSIQIDHIIPLSAAKNEEELFKLNHYTNLQVLTSEQNSIKSDFMPLRMPPNFYHWIDFLHLF